MVYITKLDYLPLPFIGSTRNGNNLKLTFAIVTTVKVTNIT